MKWWLVNVAPSRSHVGILTVLAQIVGILTVQTSIIILEQFLLELVALSLTPEYHHKEYRQNANMTSSSCHYKSP